MKLLSLLLFTALFLHAEKVTVTADRFEAFENRHLSVLEGHVHITKGADDIRAEKLVIDFNPQNKPIRYTLTGNVHFDITTQGQHFIGTARQIIYDPAQKRYIATGSVHIKETVANRVLEGEKIIIDRLSGKSTISGKKNRPVKLIFSVEE